MSTDRLGFSRRDLVALLVAAGLLLALVVTALPQTTESARRRTCMQRVGKLVKTMADFEEVHGAFPAAATIYPLIVSGFQEHIPIDDVVESTGPGDGRKTLLGPNWSMQLQRTEEIDKAAGIGPLQNCTEDKLHQGMKSFCQECSQTPYLLGAFWIDNGDHAKGRAAMPQHHRCPSAPVPRIPHTNLLTTGLENLAKANYVACVGAGTYTESIDAKYHAELFKPFGPKRDHLSFGIMTPIISYFRSERDDDPKFRGQWVFAFGKGTQARHITDGLENTIVVSELLTVDGEGETADVSEDLRGCWTSGSMGASLYSHRTTPNSSEPDVINGCEADESAYQRLDRRLLCRQQAATGITAGDTYAAARSAHPGGVVAGRADGSVDFFSDDIDPAIWRALGTRAGND